MNELKINPEFKDLIPSLSTDEYNQLEQNIIAEGCRDAIVIWRGTVVDGHNRYELCAKHGVPYQTVEKEFESDEKVKEWIIRNQFGKRNLSSQQRAKLALILKPDIEAKAKENQIAAGGDKKSEEEKSVRPLVDKPIDTLKELAKIAGVSRSTIHQVETIQNKAPESIKNAVESNEISIKKGYAITKQVKDLPEEEKTKKAKQLLGEEKQAKKVAKSKKTSQKPVPATPIEDTAQSGEPIANKEVEPVPAAPIEDTAQSGEPIANKEVEPVPAAPIEDTAQSGEPIANKNTDPVKQDNFSEEEPAENMEFLPDIQEQIEHPVEPEIKIEPVISIKDVPKLQKILEDMVADLGVAIGEVETIVNELPELGEIKHTLNIYVDALRKYAERLDSILKLKLKEGKRDVR